MRASAAGATHLRLRRGGFPAFADSLSRALGKLGTGTGLGIRLSPARPTFGGALDEAELD